MPEAELRPRVFATPTDDYVELAARFMVPVRTARSVEDELARRIAHRLEAEGIEIASSTSDVRISHKR